MVWRDYLDQKSWSGSYGIGILLRNNIGEISLVKVSKNSEILWVRVIINSINIFIGAVYLPPTNSKLNENLLDSLLELQLDCLEFRRTGKVILMGDSNCRISNLFISTVIVLFLIVLHKILNYLVHL